MFKFEEKISSLTAVLWLPRYRAAARLYHYEFLPFS